MAQELVASITDVARTKFADMLINGKSFTVTSFVIGEGGHDPADPDQALTPDPSLPFQNQTFGPKTIAAATKISPFCNQFMAVLEKAEAVGPISNLGLVATITASPIPLDPEIGINFLFAIVNMPRSIKTDREKVSYQVLINY